MDEDKILSSKDADINKATKVMRQYLEIKRAHSDKLVLFRLGDFYETFFEDALLLSKSADVILTSRLMGQLGRVPMAGIPSKSLDVYIKKLLDLNIKIVRTEQVKTADNQFERKITRIYSKGTVFENEFLESDSNRYLCAINKSNDEYGLSYCDTSDGSFYVTGAQKDEIAQELIKISPQEILLSEESLLFDFKDLVQNGQSASVCADFFNENLIKASGDEFRQGYICANAIVNYLLQMQKDFMPKLDNIKKYSISNFMSMDLNTRRALELSRNTSNFKKKGTLFALIDNTKTPMGRRLLKKWMNSPLYSVEGIIKRQNFIKEMFQKPSLRFEISEFLENLCDMLRLSAKISNKTVSIKELVNIAEALNNALKVNDIATQFQSSKLQIDTDSLNILYDFSQIINRTLDDNYNFNYEKIPVKEGANAELDLLRAHLAQLENKLKKLEEEQKNTISPEVFSSFNPSIGYYFEAGAKNASKINYPLIVKQKLKGCIRYTNDELLALEEKLCAQKFLISKLEEDILNKLREYSKELTSSIRDFARCCAYLDALHSLCLCALDNNFCAPIVNTLDKTLIKDGFHPLLESAVTNDTQLNLNDVFVNILTGANMSGKSTYLKQNAIICILAQMGSFVPAKYAEIAMCDKIFFHSLIPDSLLNGDSTFMAEMKNIAAILRNLTSKSLILLDEPVKGTNSNDAQALLRAIVEYIINSSAAKTIIATHFVSISILEKSYCAARALCIGENELRKIKHGVMKNSKAYETALAAGLPEIIIQNAQTCANL